MPVERPHLELPGTIIVALRDWVQAQIEAFQERAERAEAEVERLSRPAAETEKCSCGCNYPDKWQEPAAEPKIGLLASIEGLKAAYRPQPAAEPDSYIANPLLVATPLNAQPAAESAEPSDTEMLDWLDRTSTVTESMGQPLEYSTGITWTEHESMRAAIRAAMRSEPRS